MVYRPGNPDFEAEFERQMTAPTQKPRLREWPWIIFYIGVFGAITFGIILSTRYLPTPKFPL